MLKCLNGRLEDGRDVAIRRFCDSSDYRDSAIHRSDEDIGRKKREDVNF